MERERIIEQTKALPVSELGVEPEDSEIWEVIEEGLTFMLTKNPLPLPDKPKIYSLSISGNPSKVQPTVDEFIDVFGEPQISDSSSRGILFLSWLASEVDKKLESQ